MENEKPEFRLAMSSRLTQDQARLLLARMSNYDAAKQVADIMERANLPFYESYMLVFIGATQGVKTVE